MRPLCGYLRTRDGVVALSLVLASGLALAFFTWRTFVDRPPLQYSLDFGKARWIEHDGVSPCAYYRKTLYISGNVERAWIEVSATDQYFLYVNGILVKSDWFGAVRPAGIFDLKHLLTEGKNVISVHVPRTYYPGNAQLLVRGFYATQTGPLTEFRSDAGWKVSKTPDGIVGGYKWFDPLLDDSRWANAVEADSGEVFPTIQPVGIDPKIFEIRPAAVWLGPKMGGPLDATFECSEVLPLVRGATWLQVAATGSYDVIINDQLALSQADPQQTKLPFSKPSPAPSPAPSPNIKGVTPEQSGAPTGTKPTQVVPPLATFNLPPQAPAPTPVASLPPANTGRVAPWHSTEAEPMKPVYRAPPLAAHNSPSPSPSPSPSSAAVLPSPNIGGVTLPRFGATRPLKPFQPLAPTYAPTLVAYDVSRFMRTGVNTIRIHVRTELGVPAVLVEGHTEVAGGAIKRFSTNHEWEVRERMAGAGSTGKATVLGRYGMEPWGILPQVLADPQLLAAWDLWTPLKILLTIALIEIVVLWVWLATASWLRRTRQWSDHQGLTVGALLHLPTFAALMLFWLLSYDVRFSNNWCFTSLVVFAAFVLLLVSHLFLVFRGRSDTNAPAFLSTGNVRWKILAFAAVTLLGFCLRLHNLNTASLSSDEVMMVRYADGVISSGYPHTLRGTVDHLLATYELTVYTLANSIIVFGHTEFAYHLTSLIFSTATVALIGFVGTRMMDWRVGLTSALIYACFPASIGWARDAFYPSQEQFISLLTFWFFYEAIRGPELRPLELTLASIAFILGYFSWEGSGFILPVLLVTMFAMRWGDNRWMKDWHLWRCFIVVSCVVVSQLAYRQLTFDDYYSVGFSLADITTPALVFRNLLIYNPTYYLKVLFFSEINFTLSLFIFAGFLFCWGDRAIRYLVVVLFGLNLCYTNLLPFYAPRYCYNAEVLLILAGVGIFFKMRDRIANLGGAEIQWGWPSTLRWTGATTLTIIFLLATNEYVVKSFRLSALPLNPDLFERLGYYDTDNRGAALFIAKRFQPGDGIVTYRPQVFEYYSGKYSNYSINTLLNLKMFYDGGLEHPQYTDKFLGRPIIRNENEFRDVLARFTRVWVVIPTYPENTVLTEDMSSFLDEHGRVAFESYRQLVVLVEGPQSAASTQQTVN
jgi:hypothetical protein